MQALFAEDVRALQLQREVLVEIVGLAADAAGERLDEDVSRCWIVHSCVWLGK